MQTFNKTDLVCLICPFDSRKIYIQQAFIWNPRLKWFNNLNFDNIVVTFSVIYSSKHHPTHPPAYFYSSFIRWLYYTWNYEMLICTALQAFQHASPPPFQMASEEVFLYFWNSWHIYCIVFSACILTCSFIGHFFENILRGTC